MIPRVLESLRWSVMLLLVAPLPVAAGLLVELLLEPPIHLTRETGVTPWLDAVGPLERGDRRSVQLPKPGADEPELLAFLATYFTSPRATFEVCSAGRCATSTQQIENNTVVELPLPADFQGGEVTLALQSLTHGKLAYWAHDGQPVVRPGSDRGWSRPLARVEASFHAQAGSGWWLLLALNAVVLVGGFGLAIWRGVLERD